MHCIAEGDAPLSANISQTWPCTPRKSCGTKHKQANKQEFTKMWLYRRQLGQNDQTHWGQTRISPLNRTRKHHIDGIAQLD